MLIGGLIMLAGLFGLGMIDHTMPYWLVAVFMVLMGVGIGALVQNVVLAVQNTVDVTQIGAASAAISFFRSSAAPSASRSLRAVLTDRVASNIAVGLAELGVPAGAISGGSGETKLDISGLPGPVQEVFHNSYADAFGASFSSRRSSRSSPSWRSSPRVRSRYERRSPLAETTPPAEPRGQ